MKIIDGSGMVLGRLASHVAKESLKGEEIAIINCSEIVITGNRERIKKDFLEKRLRVGSSQKGPKHSRKTEKIVKRTIRGMLPNYREGRGREAWKRIKCYDKIPKELDGKEFIQLKKENKNKTKLTKKDIDAKLFEVANELGHKKFNKKKKTTPNPIPRKIKILNKN